MKAGDDIGKKYRQRFLKWDPISYKYDRYEWIALYIILSYIVGHLIYAFVMN